MPRKNDIQIRLTRKGYKVNPAVGDGYRYADLHQKRVEFQDGVKGTIAYVYANYFEVWCNNSTWRKGTTTELQSKQLQFC